MFTENSLKNFLRIVLVTTIIPFAFSCIRLLEPHDQTAPGEQSSRVDPGKVASPVDPVKVASRVDPVKVSVYDEALCPGCRNFVENQLGPTWQQLQDIMEVEMVAYGWAQETPSGSGYNFTCQHGPDECVGNKVIECANALVPDRDVFVRFVVCFMSSGSPAPPSLEVGNKCAYKVGIKWPSIRKCAVSKQGDDLLHEAGLKFHALDPEPQWVPWVLINGNHTGEAEKNLKAAVCKAYQGQPPRGCSP